MIKKYYTSSKNKFKTIAKTPLIINYTVIVFISYILTLTKTPLLPYSNLTLLVTTLTTLLVIYIVNSFLRLLPKKTFILIGIITSTFLALLTTINIVHYNEFYEFLSYDSLNFIYSDPTYILDYLKTYLNIKNTSILIILFIIFSAPWLTITYHKKKINFIKKIILISISIYLVHISFKDILFSMSKQTFMNYGSKSIITIIESIKGKNQKEITFVNTKNKPILPLDKSVPYNILFIPTESFGIMEGLSFYNHPNNAMPFLSNFINKNKEEFYLFKSAYTNSSATDVSMPSIFTGLHPNTSTAIFSSYPLIWDWGKSAHMYTFLVSSHRYNWAHFKELFLHEPPDYYQVAETLKNKVSHGTDSGLDDLGVVKYVKNALEKKPESQSFLGIFHPIGLHVPFQVSSQYFTPKKNINKYQTALLLFDETLKEIIGYLKQFNQLDNTIIIITSDHGEQDKTNKSKKTIPRIYSFYEDYQHIPLIIYVPKKLNINTKFLKENRNKNVQNIDIAPTIIDLLGFNLKENESLQLLEGSSLFKALPNNRVISTLNTTDFRIWEKEGFGIIYKSYRLIVSTTEGIKLFNINLDPNQKNNIWNKTDKKLKEIFIKEINSKEHLKRIWNTIN